ncbi:MAG: NADH-quinone oxidoreductase subunit N [Fibromonadales bacterium]|nr:NADH-quinone oxidoreductase subunit N [Fibromonadales bacterium]MCL2207605.1 NADH-quinone oxidoreductase subunit N [Fibromonadales bacterium]
MSPFIILDCAFILLPFLILALGLFSQRSCIVLANVSSAALALLYLGFSICGMEDASLNASLLTWHVNSFGILIRELLLISFFFASVLSSGYNLRSRPEFLAAMLFVAVGGMLVVSAEELISLFIGLELATMPMYFLVSWSKLSSKGSEAALKYVLMGSIATAVLLFGMSYLYGFAESLSYSDISYAVHNTSSVDLNLLLIGVFFIVAGVGFKLTLFPFHTWAPDVYEGAPTPVTAYLSVTSKAVSLAFLGVLVYGPLADMGLIFQLVFSGLAMATIFIGNLGALKQSRLRRFMAYSSIAQAGYILIGLCGEVRLGASSFVYYLFLYAFSNYLMFFLIGIIGKTRDESFDSLRGLSKESPLLAVLFAIAAFSLAGIPPLAGFIGKWMVFASAASVGNYALVGFAAINSVIALYYYLQVIKAAWVSDGGEDLSPLRVSMGQKIAIAFLGFAVLFFGIAPWLHSYIYSLAF